MHGGTTEKPASQSWEAGFLHQGPNGTGGLKRQLILDIFFKRVD